MKHKINTYHTQLSRTADREGESIEQMLRRMNENKEPIEASARVFYTERKDGVNPLFDIRTDRAEMARIASDKVHASNYAKRMESDGYEYIDGNWQIKAAQEQAEQGKIQGEA